MQIKITEDQLELINDALSMYLRLYKTFLKRGEAGEYQYEQELFRLMSEIEEIKQSQGG
jgi:ribosome-binding protein aMBF1 (putative translation factor)